MTNKFKHIAMMLFVAGAMVMTTSCSKDDSSSNASSIKGWYFTQTESYQDGIYSWQARNFIHIVSDNYLEWDQTRKANQGTLNWMGYSRPLAEHSGWYTIYSPIGKNFVRNGDLIVCENGWTISIDGNKLYYDGNTYYKE